jgi:amidase
MSEIDIIELTVAQVQQGLAQGRFTSEALTEAFLDRIDRFNGRYNALIFLNPDALLAARAIDRRRSTGEALPPLAGIPVVIKDSMDMVGLPTTGGWSRLHAGGGGVNLMPETDSPVVARMREAGAILLGKTNVPVLCASGTHANDSWAGPTINAAAPDYVPGGSSAGTATAVAASMCVLGLAEETGGSIQNPASAQALVGMKPTFALVPNTGLLPLSSQRDVVGPIARCVRDVALCLDVLAGFTMEDPKTVASVGRIPKRGYAAGLSNTALKGKRLGLYGPGWRDEPLSEETAELYQRAQGEIASRGATLVADPFGGTGFSEIAFTRPKDTAFDMRGLESLPYDLQLYLQRRGPGAALRSFVEFAAATDATELFGPTGVLKSLPTFPGFQACFANPETPPDMTDFAEAREEYHRVFSAVMIEQGLDALVFPQMLATPPLLLGDGRIRATTVHEINISGFPGLVVPAGYHANSVPFCLIFVGQPWAEAQLLSFAFDYEQATQHRRAPELLP